MKLYIKNMVCNRCIMVVEDILAKRGINSARVSLGEVDLGNIVISETEIINLEKDLEKLGFELINDKKSRLIESIKKAVIDLVQLQDGLHHINLSEYLGRHIAYEYNYLSSLFSSVEGITLERYFILQKIEKVKELLVYDELTLSQIAFQTGYSSLAHLSNQFKSVTGLSPSHFKKLKNTKLRKTIDNL
ncbi:MAG: AraC family transcriptional regulator [Emcibacteraceae bacterium]